jgi:hypothetical protein
LSGFCCWKFKKFENFGFGGKKLVEPSNVFTLPYLEFFNFENVKINKCVHTWANSTGYIHILNAGKLAPRVANTAHEWFWHK